MLFAIEDVQWFLLRHLKNNQEITEPIMIHHMLIKRNETGRLYAKAIQHWDQKDPKEQKVWINMKKLPC